VTKQPEQSGDGEGRFGFDEITFQVMTLLIFAPSPLNSTSATRETSLSPF
jgi:hypothetical protein